MVVCLFDQGGRDCSTQSKSKSSNFKEHFWERCCSRNILTIRIGRICWILGAIKKDFGICRNHEDARS